MELLSRVASSTACSCAATGSSTGRPRCCRASARVATSTRAISSTGSASFSFSREGTLSYVPWGGPSRIEWVDREGRTETILETPKPYLSPRLSPDGTKVLFTADGYFYGGKTLDSLGRAAAVRERIDSIAIDEHV